MAARSSGTWIVLAMLARLGLYDAAERASEGRVESCTLRVALDAAAVALTHGQSCVEAVNPHHDSASHREGAPHSGPEG